MALVDTHELRRRLGTLQDAWHRDPAYRKKARAAILSGDPIPPLPVAAPEVKTTRPDGIRGFEQWLHSHGWSRREAKVLASAGWRALIGGEDPAP